MSYLPVSVPPVLVDNTDLAFVPNTFPLWSGPITRSDGSMWLGIFTQSATLGNVYAMYKSLDGGATWSIISSRSAVYPVKQHSAIWDGGDNWLVLEQSSTSNLRVATFNFVTATWSTGTGFTPIAEAQWAWLARLSTGKLVAVYVIVTTHRMYYRFWNGSSWGTETRIGSDIEQVVSGSVYQQVAIGPAIVDAADLTHVFLWANREDDSISLQVSRLYYGQISSTGTLTVNPVLASPVRTLNRSVLRDNFSHGPWPDGLYRSESNEIILAEEFYSGDDLTHKTGIIRGTAPSSGSTISFTTAVTLTTTTDGAGLDQNKRPVLARSLDGLYPTLVLFAANYNPDSGSVEIFTQDAGSSWVGPTIYWDAAALPPAIPGTLTFGHTEMLSGTITSSSRLDFLIASLVTYPSAGGVCSIALTGHSGVSIPPGARNFAYIGGFARTPA